MDKSLVEGDLSRAALAAASGGIGHNGGPPIDLVDEAGACRVIGGAETPIHRTTLWKGIKRGLYPKPLRVGAKTNRWIRSELLAVIDRAAAQRAA